MGGYCHYQKINKQYPPRWEDIKLNQLKIATISSHFEFTEEGEGGVQGCGGGRGVGYVGWD